MQAHGALHKQNHKGVHQKRHRIQQTKSQTSKENTKGPSQKNAQKETLGSRPCANQRERLVGNIPLQNVARALMYWKNKASDN